MKCKIVLATALLGVALAHAGGAPGTAAAAQKAPTPAKAKNCTSDSGSYAPGSIVESTITTRDERGNVVRITKKYVCGQDGKWYPVASRYAGAGLAKVPVSRVVSRAARG